MVKNANRKSRIRSNARATGTNYTSALRQVDGVNPLPRWIKPPLRADLPDYIGYTEDAEDRLHLFDFAGEWRAGQTDEPHVAVLWVGRSQIGDDWLTREMIADGTLDVEEDASWFLAEMERGVITADGLRILKADHLGLRLSLHAPEWQNFDPDEAWLEQINIEALACIRKPLQEGGDANAKESALFDVFDPLWPRPRLYAGGTEVNPDVEPPLTGIGMSAQLNIEKFPQLHLAASSSERHQILYLFRPSLMQPMNGLSQEVALLFTQDQEAGLVYADLWWVEVSANGIAWGTSETEPLNLLPDLFPAFGEATLAQSAHDYLAGFPREEMFPLLAAGRRPENWQAGPVQPWSDWVVAGHAWAR